MKNKIILRKDTFSLIKQLILVELVSSIAFFIINFFVVYENLEDKSPLRYLIDIDTATLFLFIFTSILLLFIAVIHWYLRSSVYLTSTSLLYRKGLFLKMHSLNFQDIEVASYKHELMGEHLNFGSILLTKKSDKEIIKFNNITNAEYYINIIQRRIKYCGVCSTLSGKQVLELVHKKENETVEFKQTLRWDIKLNNINKELNKAVMKEICGFMNAKGGFLLIGVNDEGNITGLEADYKTLKKSNRDSFENYLRQIFDSLIGKAFTHLINLDFYNFKGKDICLIRTLPSDEPVYLKSDNNIFFYVRMGNTTKPLNVEETNKYIQLNFT